MISWASTVARRQVDADQRAFESRFRARLQNVPVKDWIKTMLEDQAQLPTEYPVTLAFPEGREVTVTSRLRSADGFRVKIEMLSEERT